MKHGMNALRRVLIPALLVLAIPGILMTTTIHGGGEKKKMKIQYGSNGEMQLPPQIYRIGEGMMLSLFPVPQNNAVGSNDYKNAITVISFPGEKMELDNYFNRAVEGIRGSGKYLPVIDPDTIGFGQKRVFHLFDFKRRKHEEHEIVFPIDETIENIAIADAGKKHFIFEIEEQNRHSVNHWDISFNLQLIDLGEKETKLIKKMPIGNGSIWVAAYGKVFLWYFMEKEIQVYDLNLSPAKHPLGDTIKNNKGKIDFTRITPHPTLPFAILHGGENEESCVSWMEGRAKTPQPILDNGNLFSFSPDGKWVAFQKEDYKRDKKMTYIMPVSEKYPNYLGTPILLTDADYFKKGKFAWTKNPIGFVGSSGDGALYRWELTNETYPESDKATFHDYIVEKDLERLEKDKKK